MIQRILLISDIHGNYPALKAIHSHFNDTKFKAVINCGDSLVYAPFPNETLDWLRQHATISILGNTDKKVIKLLRGKSFKKPARPEKRIMYESTSEALTKKNSLFIQGLKKKSSLIIRRKTAAGKTSNLSIEIFHGSPAAHHEFLFDTTSNTRFKELAALCKADIVVTGHSHTPYHKEIGGTHFINPGSIGRMFDGNPAGSCATLTVTPKSITVDHYRIPYNVKAVIREISKQGLPNIYSQMYLKGCKLN